jgi:membrane protein DedA with SNARE-associated domain
VALAGLRAAAALNRMPLEQTVATWGLFGVFLGTFFEGETILVLGGFLAHRGYLSLPWVIAAAFAGSFCGDQLFFFIGRRQGLRALERHPRWQERAARVLGLLRRHETPVILGFRFIYGIRSVTPFVLGAGGSGPLRFLLLNGIGAAVWAAAIGTLGYLLGHSIEVLLGEVKRFELAIAGAILLVGAAVWLVRRRAGDVGRQPRPPAGPR